MRPVAWGMAAAAALPVAYIIKQHVSWESSPRAKKRMLAHHLGFWTSMAAGLVLLHRKVLRNRSAGALVRALYGVAAGLLPVLGFEGGGRLALLLFPEAQASSSAGDSVSGGRRYVPSYLNVQA